jgi:hypothetical protein
MAVFLVGCGAIDTILPSSGKYRVKAHINGIPLEEFSFAGSGDNIRIVFEDPVSNDPDVTALMVYLVNARGEIVGWRVIYTLDTENALNPEDNPEENEDTSNTENENTDTETNEDTEENDENIEDAENVENTAVVNRPAVNGEELIILVGNLDKELPAFPIPSDLPMGMYTLISHVLRGNATLSRIEKTFFYMADAVFSFDSIQVHQSSTAASLQLIPRGAMIMLEAVLDFDDRLDPYIVWYNGRRIIGEGNFSEGAGNLLWRTPEQNGFFSLRAEIFPVNLRELSGYQRTISLLVSARNSEMNFSIDTDNPELRHWYLFEGNLSDSLMPSSLERALNPAGNIVPRWLPADGVFGLAAGPQNVYSLPKVLFSGNTIENARILSSFKILNNGNLVSIQFGPSLDVGLNLLTIENNLILSLVSPEETVSNVYPLPEDVSFIFAEISFSLLDGVLSARLDLPGMEESSEDIVHVKEPISLEAAISDEFTVTLGCRNARNITLRNSAFTAIWDELVLFLTPSAEPEPEVEVEIEVDSGSNIEAEAEIEIIIEENLTESNEELPEPETAPAQ